MSKSSLFLVPVFFLMLLKTALAADEIPATLIREWMDQLNELSDVKPSRIREEFSKFSKNHSISDANQKNISLIAQQRNTQPLKGVQGVQDQIQSLTENSIFSTINSYGVEIQVNSPFHELIMNTVRPSMTVVDIGCAYGFISQQLLARGAKVIAVDIDPAHLAILIQKTKREWLNNLSVLLGKFPESVMLEKDSVDMIILGQVIHFFTDKQLEIGLRNATEALKSSGYMMIMASTIYENILSKFTALLEKAVTQAKAQISSTSNKELIFPTYLPQVKGVTPPYGTSMIHPQDLEILQFNLSQLGLTPIDQGAFKTGFSQTTPPRIIFFDTQSVPGNHKNSYLYLGAQKSISVDSLKLSQEVSESSLNIGSSTTSEVKKSIQTKHCDVCLNPAEKLYTCSQCKARSYCGTTCQTKDWHAGHKSNCKPCKKSEPASKNTNFIDKV